MPELPDIEAYLVALRPRLLGETLCELRLLDPFLLRTVAPPPAEVSGRLVVTLERLGKRIVLGLQDDVFLVLHLMIAGRLQWREVAASPPKGKVLARLDFSSGLLFVTEAGSRRRASLHLVEGREALAGFDRGGLEVLQAGAAEFERALLRENHTLKRALTDPSIFSGIGNAYSDEILHRARLSPFKQTRCLSHEEVVRLHAAAVGVLEEWVERLTADARESFPVKVTAFRPEMAVHGRYRAPCPVCGTAVQRIRYAENESDYCPRCQTEGRLLADRALSRLLKADGPKTIDELEQHRGRGDEPAG
jgi:formamidopyrimidine-DNA glycosylase